MYSKVDSSVVMGLEVSLVEVEADIRDGLPGMEMVGALGTEVREARERVRTALSNAGFRLPPRKITVNLSPSDIRKVGNGFDVPIAVSILLAMGYIQEGSQEGILFAGELGLNGDVRAVNGILPVVLFGVRNGYKTLIVPEENLREAKAVGGNNMANRLHAMNEADVKADAWDKESAAEILHGIEAESVKAVGVSNLVDIVEYMGCRAMGPEQERKWLYEHEERRKSQTETEKEDKGTILDFADLIGQKAVRRAAEVAVSGRHNFLMVGPPGSGKTMVASRIPGILPKLSREEILEVSQIYSVCGYLNAEHPLITERPFRAPHHTVTATTLIGGGRIPRPGEVSLADRGVLFLDELTEFHKNTLDTLRQPLEDGKIRISRNQGSFEFPADFMLVAGMNPCPCGYYPDRTRCHCEPYEIRRYLAHVSRPLLDRIDVCVEAAALPMRELMTGGGGESTAVIRERVLRTQKIQQERFRGEDFSFNSQIPSGKIDLYCALGTAERSVMEKIFNKLQLSARGYHKILKVARTIADMEGKETIGIEHLSEAAGYRSIESKFWEA